MKILSSGTPYDCIIHSIWQLVVHLTQYSTAKFSKYFLIFADRVHVSNHWLLVQALAHAPIPNYDIPWALYSDHFDQWFAIKHEPVDLTTVII